MTEKKNIVIKIKRPTLQPETEIRGVAVTQWHWPRIMMAVTALLVVLSVLFYSVLQPAGDEDHQASQVKTSSLEPMDKQAGQAQISASSVSDRKPQESLPPKQTADNAKQESQLSDQQLSETKGRVRRALLASTIIGKEPGDDLGSLITASDARPVRVYYFTEIRGMNGEKVYHEWSHKGKNVYRHTHEIAAQRWRTTSHQLMDTHSAGDWQVKTTDNQGRLLNELFFTIK